MRYQLTFLLFVTIWAVVGAFQPLPKEPTITNSPSDPIDPETAYLPRRFRGLGRAFESGRSRKKFRALNERDRFRRKTWERESGSVTTGSRDISARSGSIARSGRRGRIRF